MQFQVPQFIEVEDKIFGPFTFKQFVYLIGAAGLAYLLWRVLPIFLSGPLILVVGAFAGALAFLQYNGRPFIIALETGFFFLIHPKLYLWNNERPKANIAKTTTGDTNAAAGLFAPKLSDSKLHELAWSLDIKERIAAGTASEDEKGADSVMAIRTPALATKLSNLQSA